MVLTHPSAAVADLASTHGFQRPIRQSVRARREMRALTRHTEFKGKFALRSPHSNRILGNRWSARPTQYFDKWCCKLTTRKRRNRVPRSFTGCGWRAPRACRGMRGEFSRAEPAGMHPLRRLTNRIDDGAGLRRRHISRTSDFRPSPG
jgi:hypothetical protein